MNELITVSPNTRFPVSGRELHVRLRIGTQYKDWFPRMCEYGFSEGEDFCSKMSESTGGRPSQDHGLTIDMAKEISMIQRSKEGREIRRYLISVEDKWNQPAELAKRLEQTTGGTIDLKAKRVEIMERNSITRQGQILAKLADHPALSDAAKEHILINAAEIVSGKVIPFRSALPDIKYWGAEELAPIVSRSICEHYGVTDIIVSATQIGNVANRNNLKDKGYGMTVLGDKKKALGQVPTFQYNEVGRDALLELFLHPESWTQDMKKLMRRQGVAC